MLVADYGTEGEADWRRVVYDPDAGTVTFYNCYQSKRFLAWGADPEFTCRVSELRAAYWNYVPRPKLLPIAAGHHMDCEHYNRLPKVLLRQMGAAFRHPRWNGPPAPRSGRYRWRPVCSNWRPRSRIPTPLVRAPGSPNCAA